MQIACISVPQRGTIAPNGRATAPGPRGLRPPPLPLRSGRFPCYLPSGRSVCKNHGGASAGRASGSRLLAGGQLLAVVHGATPKGKRRGAKAPPGIQLQGRRPSSWGWRSRPKSHQGSRLSVGKCSESTYRRKWQNGGMAHFAILRVQKLKSAVAVHRSMKHSFRAQDTPNADAELTHLNSISARTAWPRAWPHSGRGCRRASARMLSRRSST